MVQVYNKDEFRTNKGRLLRELQRSLFIYPTDTIYGIGCNARDEELVRKVRAIKRRHDLPFSVIAPSKEWILEHCDFPEEELHWLDKLPGPYTLILKLKRQGMIPESVNKGLDTLGVRIPDNWFAGVVAELGIPIVTTSANLSGEDYMTSLEDLNPAIKKGVEHIFYTGEIEGRPSTLVRLDKESPELHKR